MGGGESGNRIGNRVAENTSKKQKNGEWILTLVEMGQKRKILC